MDMFSVFLSLYVGIDLLSNAALCLTIWWTARLFSEVTLHHFTIWLAIYENFNFFTSLPTLFCLFYFGHPCGWENLTEVLIFISLMTWCWKNFHVFFSFAICISSLEKCDSSSLPILKVRLFAFIFLSCENYLYNLHTNLLSYMWFENVFSFGLFFHTLLFKSKHSWFIELC